MTGLRAVHTPVTVAPKVNRPSHRAGQGRAGQGRAGQGRAGQGCEDRRTCGDCRTCAGQGRAGKQHIKGRARAG